MRVLLVNPANLRGSNYVIIPNVGLGYLASSVQREGHVVSLLDCVKDRVDLKRFARYLRDHPQDVVGFNTFTPSVSAVRQYVGVARRVIPSAILVLGGPHPTFEPEETMTEVSEADFSFMGEAEEGFPCLLDELAGTNRPSNCDRLKGIAGLVWREGSRLRLNPRVVIADLDRNGIPAWDLVRPETYPVAPNGIFSKTRHIAPIIATRGCPFPCTFCGAGRSLGKKVRRRSIGNLMAEMDLLEERHGVREIHIMDDNFTFDREYAAQFCEAVLQRKKQMFWALPNGVRLDSLDEELLRSMERAGCYSMAVGIESGNQHVLDHIRKHLTLEQISEKIHLIKRVSRIKVTGFFILGYPTETRREMNNTIDFALRLPLDRANFFNYTPFPGSEIYERLKQNGTLKGIRFEDLYIHNISYSPTDISRREMLRFPRQAHLRFYLRPRILWNLAKEVKSLDQMKIILQRARTILFQRIV